MASRYFSSEPIRGKSHVLRGDEAHHLGRVMRAQADERIVLFDGTGAEFDARITRISRSEVELAIEARREIDREVAGELTLAVALPKGDRQRWLIEKAVELGVARIIPLRTERSVALPTASAVGRLERGVVEAAKQCGRNRLMEIAEALPWSELVQSSTSGPRFVAHPGESSVEAGDLPSFATGQALVAIGPEGGFTEDEVAEALAHGWQRLDLGRRVLRVETAALAVAALWAHRAG